MCGQAAACKGNCKPGLSSCHVGLQRAASEACESSCLRTWEQAWVCHHSQQSGRRDGHGRRRGRTSWKLLALFISLSQSNDKILQNPLLLASKSCVNFSLGQLSLRIIPKRKRNSSNVVPDELSECKSMQTVALTSQFLHDRAWNAHSPLDRTSHVTTLTARGWEIWENTCTFIQGPLNVPATPTMSGGSIYRRQCTRTCISYQLDL